jgi:hypothetical protein
VANVEREVRNDARDTGVARVGTKLGVILGDELENLRNQLRTTLPIRRVVGPADAAALAVHIVTNTALTGATYDVDGGQQFVAA